MNRANYNDDCEMWSLIRWRGQVASAIRGKRGQLFLLEMVAALDAMPEKKLIREDIVDDCGSVCALGAVAKFRRLELEKLDPYAHDDLAKTFGIAHQLVQEIEYENDENCWYQETPEKRWERMRAWAVSQLRDIEIPA